jgi:hypothetical protein
MYDNAMAQQIELSRIQLHFAPTTTNQEAVVVNGARQAVTEKLFMPTSRRKHL